MFALVTILVNLLAILPVRFWTPTTDIFKNNIKLITINTCPIIFLHATSSFMHTLRKLFNRGIQTLLTDISSTIDNYTYTKKLTPVSSKSRVVTASKDTPSTTVVYEHNYSLTNAKVHCTIPITTASKPISARLRRRQGRSKIHDLSALPMVMVPTGGYNCAVM